MEKRSRRRTIFYLTVHGQRSSSPPLRPVKGQFIRLKGNDQSLLERVIRTPDVYCVPRNNGEIFLGATMEEEGFNSVNTAGPIMDFLYHSFQIIPAVYELSVQEIGSGFRPALRDNQPLISPSHLKNCWFNTLLSTWYFNCSRGCTIICHYS